MSYIKASEAVRAAIGALPEFLGGKKPLGVRVEEVLPPEAGQDDWRITLSFLEEDLRDAPPWRPDRFVPLLHTSRERVLRVIAIGPEDGSPKKMTMREAG